MVVRRSGPSFIALLSSSWILCACVSIYTLASPLGQGLQKRTSRLTPPAGAIVVSQTPASGQFSTIQAAVNALPDDDSAQTIFINAGTYSEQVNITRTGMLTIMGATSDVSTYTANEVTITHSASLGTAGSDDLSGTLRVHKDDFALYNINVKNTFGEAAVNGQAIALSAYG